jgi:SNF2 family DNA or RNA helicase
MSAKIFNLPIKMTAALVAKLFPANVVQKAQNYVIQGRVLDVISSNDNHNIEAHVSGTQDEPYRQDITLVNINHKVLMNAHCTCPVRQNCKHVAAALLTLVDKKPVEEQRLNQWLMQLDEQETIQRQESEQEEVEKDRIIFVLSSDHQGVFVEFKRSKLNKKGQFNRGSKMSLTEVKYHIPWWVTKEDGQVVSLLLSVLAANHHASKIYLEGEICALALNKMLSLCTCFWEDSRFAISQTQALAPEFVWLELDKKHTQMQMQMPSLDNWEFIATVPPMFMDLDYLKIGLLQTELSTSKLKLLQQMPPVPLTQVDSISHKMLKHFSPKSVPVPADIEFYEVQHPLKVRLTLTMMTFADEVGAGCQPGMKLEFVYGDQILSGRYQREAISLIKKGKVQYQLHRDLDAESAVAEVLKGRGFNFIDKIDLALSDANHTFATLGMLPMAIHQWSAFCNETDQKEDGLRSTKQIFESLGYELIETEDFDLNIVAAKLDINLDDDEDSGWFSLSLNADIDGQSVPLLALVARWLQQHGEPDDEQSLLLPSPNGGFIQVKAKTIKPLISIIKELFDRHNGDQLKVPRSRAHLLNELSASDIRLLNGERIQRLAAKLAQFKGIVPVTLPDGLNATLRDYQKQGLDWLCFLKEYQLGGILADDMGLGKTIQALAFLLKEKQQRELNPMGPEGASTSLIICPTSLIGNWFKEASKFTPSLKVLVIHGNKRQDLLVQIEEYDLVVTTYPLLLRDDHVYSQIHFEHIILDEAQLIKNAQAKVTQLVKTLKGRFKLCLSGTPLENHLGELKSLMDFCLPGLLGQHSHFLKEFRNPIEKQGDKEKLQLLSQRMSPFLLRRTKQDVAAELPEKTVIISSLTLEKDQRNLYESIRLVMEKKLRELFAKKGVASSHIEFLDALLKLRQACCDPRLVKLEQAQKVKSNAKLTWLTENLSEMIEEGRKVLIFSQFTGMLALIEDELIKLGIGYSKLTGKTQHRQVQIDDFQEGRKPVFLISLKAGGTGLNLTTADTVIHFDPWWNPAAERQATDRAHRIGQLNPVFVYKLIAQGTVEEKIQEMQIHKQGLADSILSDKEQGPWQGSAEDLLALLS